WNINVLEAAPLPTGWPAMPNTKPFFYLCLIQQLLRTICPHSSWGHRLATLLEKEFPAMPNRAVTLEDLGVCENWGAWDLWRHK
ncbi:MAG TPA: hypothetical protein VFA14_05760, partial [Herbaspirillum sp.]|nr:hypothetical protein [Herbaspirillum sp.]